MRRANSFITIGIIALFLFHMIYGCFVLIGWIRGGSVIFKFLSYLMALLIFIHIVISCILSVQTVRASRRAGAFYLKDNMLFMIRRISGFALVIFMLDHVFLFRGRYAGGTYLLNDFTAAGLITQILLVVSLIVHLSANITPLRIALGITDKRNTKTDVIAVLSVLLLLSAIAFVVYYFRFISV